MNCPWGDKLFTAYLGEDKQEWAKYDASQLVKDSQLNSTILIDQGTEGYFLSAAAAIAPNNFNPLVKKAGQKLNLRWQKGYESQLFYD